jgi:hypothetical protein
MSHPFDATLKDIYSHRAADLAPVLHLPAGLPCRSLNIDLSTISAATDVAFGFGDPLEAIVDINFQSGPDPQLAGRLHLYNAAYHHHYPVAGAHNRHPAATGSRSSTPDGPAGLPSGRDAGRIRV